MVQQTTTDAAPQTIPHVLADAAERWSDASAIEDGDTTLTYRQLQEAVQKAARALISVGVEHGDRVGIWAPNCWEWIVAGLAIHSVGAAIIPLNPRYKGEEAR